VALRSVVVEAPASPPAPRRTVVVRAGGPAPKGRVLDIVMGVLGALLLIVAVALAQVLPDKTYINPQFRLTFEPIDVEGPGSFDHDLFETGEQSWDFPYEVTEDNVGSVSLILGFEDDVSFSLPDRFDIDLIAPNGTQMGHVELENPAPKGGASPADPATFTNAELNAQFSTAPAFQEQIVTGLTPTETPEQVLARLAPDYHVDSKGTWIVRVTLVAAGDCPAPGEETYVTQSRDCRFGPPTGAGDPSESPDGADPGNNFLVASFKYTYFTPTIKELA
jgi:hypothetical protein